MFLSGCLAGGGIERASLNELVDDGEALAFPPPSGPAILDIVERSYSNAIRQDIILATESTVTGANRLRVDLFGPVDSSSDTKLPNRRITQGDIRREMVDVLPGVAMQVSPFYVQNDYGPFGYAVGRASSGDLCLYAWQRIEAAAHLSRFFDNRGTIQIRLRLCERGATEESLLAVMYGYTLAAVVTDQVWNPFGTPPPLDPALGRKGEPIYPRSPYRNETVVEPRVAQPAVARASERTAPVRRVERATLPEAVGPTVPLPPEVSAPRSAAPSSAAAPTQSTAVPDPAGGTADTTTLTDDAPAMTGRSPRVPGPPPK